VLTAILRDAVLRTAPLDEVCAIEFHPSDMIAFAESIHSAFAPTDWNERGRRSIRASDGAAPNALGCSAGVVPRRCYCPGTSLMVRTTLEVGRLLRVGSFWSLSTASSNCGKVVA
jgi:hypothetical protein